MKATDTGMQDPDRRSAKRMRLGTRSCRECRRRKVRCIYPEHGASCKECQIRGVVCKSQQAAEQDSADTGSNGSNLLQRLKTLESYIAQVHTSLENISHSASPGSGGSDAARTLVTPSPPNVPFDEKELAKETTGVDNVGQRTPLTSLHALEFDAPLLSMLKDALVIEPQRTAEASASVDVEGTRQPVIPLRALPNSDLLMSLLQASDPYWFLWPVSPATGPSRVTDACSIIKRFLGSDRSILVSKSLLWLTLCVQQMVGENRQLLRPLNCSQSVLAETYLYQAIRNTPPDLESCDFRDGLECFLLQMKIYINFGRPHNAWQAVRRAINTALLLGLDRNGNTDAHGQGLFQMAWQYDRNLSSLLSLPPSIAEDDPALVACNTAVPWQYRTMRELAIIAGHIARRDRAGQIEDDTVTRRIESEIELVRALVPADAWLRALPDGLSFEQYNVQYQIEIYLYNSQKLLHMPFALKESADYGHVRRRELAFDAARNICTSYQIMRSRTRGQLMMCDLADFQVFTGAATLVLGLLYGNSGSRGTNDEEADWQLIDSVTALMRQSHKLVDCSVAGQAADLLENLSLARHGLLPSDEEYCAVIPYFGRFRIRRRPRGVDAMPNDPAQGAVGKQSCCNSIEFDPQFPLDLGGTLLPEEPLSDIGYGADWLGDFEVEGGYDWSAMFEQPLVSVDIQSAGYSCDAYLG